MYLFEKTFKHEFDVKFVQKEKTVAGSYYDKNRPDEQHVLSQDQVRKIKLANEYDIKLYKYAEELFFKRIRYFRRKELKELQLSQNRK